MEFPPQTPMSPDDASRAKRQKLLQSADYYKTVLKNWEAAITKAEGRKPGKTDLKTAPEKVQKAYKEYYKINKYLQRQGTDSSKKGTPKSRPSPRKIFYPKVSSPGVSSSIALRRTVSSSSPLRRRASVQKALNFQSTPPKTKIKSILRPDKKKPDLRQPSFGTSFSNFREKISTIVQVFSSRQDTNFTNKPHTKIKVTDPETGEEVERKALIPTNRFAKSLSAPAITTGENVGHATDATNTDKKIPGSTSKSSQADSLLPPDETDDIQFSNLVLKNNEEDSKQNMKRLSSVSAVWQNFSPNPKSRKRNRSKSNKINSDWLNRCRNEGEDENKDSSYESIDMEVSTEDPNTSGKLYDEGFQNFLLSSSNNKSDNSMTESGLNASNNSSINDSTGSGGVNPSSFNNKASNSFDQCDSGLGLSSSFVLSADDIMEVAKEILPTTTSNNNYNYSNPSSSSQYDDVLSGETSVFHSEDACSPHENSFQTIDINAVGDLLNACPFSNGILNSNNASQSSSANDVDNQSKNKRKAFEAFTPSPKKSPTKKFFKSSRGTRNLPKYNVNSYKPLTPVKKKPSSKTATAKKDTNTKAPKTNKNHNSDKMEAEDDEENVKTTKTSPPEEKKRKAPVKNTRSTKTTKTKGKPEKIEETSRISSNKSVNSTYNTAGPSTSSAPVDYFDEIVQTKSGKGKGRSRGRRKPETLESKMSRGVVNDNFVKIDITKKVFVRGRKKMSGVMVKRADWKTRTSLVSKQDKLKSLTCRKCGESGHFQKFCIKDTLPKDQPEQIDDSPFPSLEEAAMMVKSRVPNTTRVNVFAPPKVPDTESTSSDKILEISDAIMMECGEDNQNQPPPQSNDPLLQPSQRNLPMKPVSPFFMNETGIVSQDEEESILNEAIVKFGFEDFRPGQRDAVTRILKGLSTLCVLSTGSGKSLCYQLPAYLYAKKYPGALAICVSPLVSLMEDQVQGIPGFLQAAFLHSNMPTSQRDKVLERIRARELHILLVSPEAVCGGLFGILRGQDLPQISFACIDEVHCVSQWSHNFRPCYLQLAKILREKLQVNTILGLTATATEYTANSICTTLRVDPSTVIRGEIIPSNLNLSVSRDVNRDEALLTLLAGERFLDCDSIIIYCTRRDECQRISSLLRTSLREDLNFKGVSKHSHRRRISNTCEAYHAGMTAGRRRLVQQQFMSGKIRIVVATVAFGMGIDKSDIRSVIHYNMPKNFESYVQEIGRAGRDGLPAQCHLFLDNVKGRDLSELQRHVYSNSIDRPTIRRLIRKVFQSCKCARIAEMSHHPNKNKPGPDKKDRCPGHETSFSIEETVTDLDLPEENISTLLCYLELDPAKRWIELLPHTYETCKIHSYGGAALLKSAALKCPPLAAAIALKRENKKFKEADFYLEFNIIEVAATLGWNSGIVKRELKNLEWSATLADSNGNGSRFRKSGLLVEFCNLAFHVTSPGDLSDEEADAVLNYLHGHNTQQEKSQLYQLSRVYQALLSVSNSSVDAVCDGYDEDKSQSLKTFIHRYFSQNTLGVPKDWKYEVTVENNEDGIRRDVQDLLASVQDAKFTGRSVARIFQGIPSPCFPAETWARNRSFWRKHLNADFHYLCQIAGQEIVRF